MPHFYFDLKNGVPLQDRAGCDCFDDGQARNRADDLARTAAVDYPDLVGKGYISVVDDRGSEIYRSRLVKRSIDKD